jgi:hypothetical protein
MHQKSGKGIRDSSSTFISTSCLTPVPAGGITGAGTAARAWVAWAGLGAAAAACRAATRAIDACSAP